MARSRVSKIKRIYDPPADDDGFRVLVDRLWPRAKGEAIQLGTKLFDRLAFNGHHDAILG